MPAGVPVFLWTPRALGPKSPATAALYLSSLWVDFHFRKIGSNYCSPFLQRLIRGQGEHFLKGSYHSSTKRRPIACVSSWSLGGKGEIPICTLLLLTNPSSCVAASGPSWYFFSFVRNLQNRKYERTHNTQVSWDSRCEVCVLANADGDLLLVIGAEMR